MNRCYITNRTRTSNASEREGKSQPNRAYRRSSGNTRKANSNAARLCLDRIVPEPPLWNKTQVEPVIIPEFGMPDTKVHALSKKNAGIPPVQAAGATGVAAGLGSAPVVTGN